VSDAGWYAGAYEGLLLIRDSLGAQVSNQQTRTPAEYDEAFRSYATSGYDLIFAHGFEYQDAAVRAGEMFPDLTIVVSNGGRITDNVHPLIMRLEEAAYLAGMVAGATTRTGTVGMVGGVAIPPAVGTFRAFEAGVQVTAPGTEVLEAFIGSWDDVAAAKEATVAQLQRGADVVIHNTDAASFGVFQAVREAVESGQPVWAMGMNRDQNDVAPDVILGSAVIRIPEAFLQVAERMTPDGLTEGIIATGLATGAVDYVPNPVQAAMHPADLLRQLEEAREGIRTGELEVPRIEFLEDNPGS
jgi:basic membrane lipoprotein Med (substrate-binding protein (PBP1-ABC) superfamily)